VALASVCSALAIAASAAPAGAITFSQQTLPFSGLSSPYGVAVDQSGDVFVADSENNRVLELPAGVSSGVGVDLRGDVFVVDQNNDRVVELPAGSSSQVTLPSIDPGYGFDLVAAPRPDATRTVEAGPPPDRTTASGATQPEADTRPSGQLPGSRGSSWVGGDASGRRGRRLLSAESGRTSRDVRDAWY